MTTHRKLIPALTALLVATAGFVSLAQVLSIRIRHHQFGRIDDSLLPFTAAQDSHLLIVGLGVLLLYLSLQVFRRKLLAFELVRAGLVLLLAVEILQVRNVAQAVFYALTLILLQATKKQYDVEANNLSLRHGAAMAGMVIAVVFIYATIGFARLETQAPGNHISMPTAAKYAAREVFTFQETQRQFHSRRARWFEASVNGASLIAYTLAVFSLFRPLRFQYGPTRYERSRALHILERYSTSTEDYFKLWPPDKHFFFSTDDESFIAYKVVGSDALVLGEPVGNPASLAGITAAFAAFCRQNGWAASYIYADARLGDMLGTSYRRLFIGNEAIIDVAEFAAETARNKHFRYVRNKAGRDGLEFRYWPAPLSERQLSVMQTVSTAWLGARNRREYTFAMGYFDRDYLRNCDVAVLERDGELVAYVNILPVLSGTHARSIDHMRHVVGLPPTGMHYLLMEMLARFNEDGVTEFNLGLVPLSGIEDLDDPTLAERLLSVLKKFGSRYYSSEGLEQFKNKFQPDWQPRYLYYKGTQPRLIRLMGNLNKALSVPLAGQGVKRSMVTLSVISALAYGSFPLGYFINPKHAHTDIVSELGSGGQPYAWLFNGLDICSSLILFAIAAVLWKRYRPEIQPLKLPLFLFMIGTIATLLAAVTPLPLHAMTNHFQIILHDFFSCVSVLGIGAAAAWFARERRSRMVTFWFLLFSVSLIVAAIFDDYPSGPDLQRINILLTSVWMVMVVVFLSGAIKPRPRV